MTKLGVCRCARPAPCPSLQLAARAGIDHDKEMHNPLLVRAVYGQRPPKMVVVVRNPLPRLLSAFYGYPHYFGKYGEHRPPLRSTGARSAPSHPVHCCSSSSMRARAHAHRGRLQFTTAVACLGE